MFPAALKPQNKGVFSDRRQFYQQFFSPQTLVLFKEPMLCLLQFLSLQPWVFLGTSHCVSCSFLTLKCDCFLVALGPFSSGFKAPSCGVFSNRHCFSSRNSATKTLLCFPFGLCPQNQTLPKTWSFPNHNQEVLVPKPIHTLIPALMKCNFT